MNRSIIVILAVCIVMTASHVFAQETITPTPAPSKTPSAVPSEAAVSTPAISAPFETLTQADLTRLTGNVQRPNGIAWFDDKLYTACTGDSTVYEIDDTTGSTRTLIYGVQNAQTLFVEEDASNNDALTLWVPDYEANTLSKVTRNGVEAVVRGLNGPWGIAYVDEEHFLVTNLLANTINLLSRSGDNVVTLDGLSAPMGLVHDGESVFVANYGSTRRSIEWYSFDALTSVAEATEVPEATSEAEVTDSPNTPPEADATNHVLVSGLQNATSLQLGADGLLYFSYALGNRGLVGRVDPAVCMADGGCTNDQVEIVLYSDLSVPLAGLTLTPDMRMYVHTMFTPELYWVQLEG